ncbi:MAG: DUF4101 domain-containing protein [Chloroflexi bacterium]|nr:DUF4101 domain-containing protein [Chloroflexota bacterium]
MSFRRRQSAAFPWQSVGLFVGGAILGAIALVLVLGNPGEEPPGAENPTPSTTQVSAAGEGAYPTIAPEGEAEPEGAADPEGEAQADPQNPTPEPPAEQPTMPALPTSAPPSPTPRPSPTVPTREQIEAAIVDAVERFQEAKEESQRTGETSGLSAVLAKSALQRQTALVDDTRAAGCYWEISLDSPMQVEIDELRDDNYARVTVFKTESRKKYCDGALESSVTGDAYETWYVVERIDSRWYVTERE